MIAENVTLIVKAPNQQIEDQNIECQSSWTVRQLKGHLSEVYPSKPSTEEQKIIYSGQLLDDNTVLKDVLRTYESQIGHTMHLVCAPSKTMTNPTAPEPPKDGLRQRNVTTERPEPATRPEMRQNDQNHTVEMQNYLTSFVNNYGRVPPYPNYNIGEGYLPVPNDQASLANHMLMMQQAYMRYMQQYANMWQATANAPPASPTAEAPPAPPAQDHPPAAANDEEEHQHDWLDHIYSASRLAILFSIIYLYGSPARLLLIIMIGAAVYLHQIGFFRELLMVNDENANANRAAQRNQQPQQPQPNPQQPQPNPQQPQPNPQQPQANNQQLPNPQQAQPNPQPQPNLQQPQPQPQPTPNREELNRNQTEQHAPSFFAITWMVFTSFFASLIPDTNQ